jgi:glycosyltransferase involved in cell wall biosynthesis
MHVLIFCEQHPHTLGGAQVSVNLQAEFLERAGHVVTFVSPALRTGPVNDPRFIDLPSHAVPTVANYTWMWPNDRHSRLIDEALSTRPPVDIVHVQSDFWGAALGYRFAREHGVKLVHTMHHRLDVGVDGSIPFPWLFYAMLTRWQRWSLGEGYVRTPLEAFGYLGGYAHHADVVTAPSTHFARLLTKRDVVARRNPEIAVVPTGVNDDVLDDVARRPRTAHGVPVIAWVGRFSPEKRLLEFLRGVNAVTSAIRVRIAGDGALAPKAKAIAGSNVEFLGAVDYPVAIETIADADVLVQSSNGFETQGMTVTEAVAMGTHVVIVDGEIGEDLPKGSFTLTRDLSDEAMAAALESASATRVVHDGPRDLSHLAEFRQSKRTEQMLGQYARALGR